MDQAFKTDKSNRDSYAISREIELLAARWKMLQHTNPDVEFRSAIQYEKQGINVEPSSRGIFFLFQARSVNNLSQRKAFAEKAQTTLRDALKLNANLSHAFTPYLKEAERLAKSL